MQLDGVEEESASRMEATDSQPVLVPTRIEDGSDVSVPRAKGQKAEDLQFQRLAGRRTVGDVKRVALRLIFFPGRL